MPKEKGAQKSGLEHKRELIRFAVTEMDDKRWAAVKFKILGRIIRPRAADAVTILERNLRGGEVLSALDSSEPQLTGGHAKSHLFKIINDIAGDGELMQRIGSAAGILKSIPAVKRGDARWALRRMPDADRAYVLGFIPPNVFLDDTERDRKLAEDYFGGGLKTGELASKYGIKEHAVKSQIGLVLRNALRPLPRRRIHAFLKEMERVESMEANEVKERLRVLGAADRGRIVKRLPWQLWRKPEMEGPHKDILKHYLTPWPIEEAVKAYNNVHKQSPISLEDARQAAGYLTSRIRDDPELLHEVRVLTGLEKRKIGPVESAAAMGASELEDYLRRMTSEQRTGLFEKVTSLRTDIADKLPTMREFAALYYGGGWPMSVFTKYYLSGHAGVGLMAKGVEAAVNDTLKKIRGEPELVKELRELTKKIISVPEKPKPAVETVGPPLPEVKAAPPESGKAEPPVPAKLTPPEIIQPTTEAAEAEPPEAEPSAPSRPVLDKEKKVVLTPKVKVEPHTRDSFDSVLSEFRMGFSDRMAMMKEAGFFVRPMGAFRDLVRAGGSVRDEGERIINYVAYLKRHRGDAVEMERLIGHLEDSVTEWADAGVNQEDFPRFALYRVLAREIGLGEGISLNRDVLGDHYRRVGQDYVTVSHNIPDELYMQYGEIEQFYLNLADEIYPGKDLKGLAEQADKM